MFLEQFDSVYNYEEPSVTLYSSNMTFEYIQLPSSYSGLVIKLSIVIFVLVTIGLFELRRHRKRKQRRNLQLITKSINESLK